MDGQMDKKGRPDNGKHRHIKHRKARLGLLQRDSWRPMFYWSPNNKRQSTEVLQMLSILAANIQKL